MSAALYTFHSRRQPKRHWQPQ